MLREKCCMSTIKICKNSANRLLTYRWRGTGCRRWRCKTPWWGLVSPRWWLVSSWWGLIATWWGIIWIVWSWRWGWHLYYSSTYQIPSLKTKEMVTFWKVDWPQCWSWLQRTAMISDIIINYFSCTWHLTHIPSRQKQVYNRRTVRTALSPTMTATGG